LFNPEPWADSTGIDGTVEQPLFEGLMVNEIAAVANFELNCRSEKHV
jgi:hypothetical protein